MPKYATKGAGRDLAEQAMAVPEPSRRHLRVFAFDPLVARLPGTEAITLSVPYEPLRPGPGGELVQVIDYDGAQGYYYEPVDLDDRRLLLSTGAGPWDAVPHHELTEALGAGDRLLVRSDDENPARPGIPAPDRTVE
ncbi:hypothetical protein [Nocardia sp. CA-119907]|uniref:hypothetical protein n=1 Tax=Nocardia sp. CA-119907 TaxID=3239973 RepID=UPI003D9952C1